MTTNMTNKSNRIISFDKLTDELKELFAEAYPQPDGYEPYLKKIIKPDGTPIFVVPLETSDISYMVKFEVKIDAQISEDELEKDLFGDGSKGGEMSDLDILEQNERGEKDDAHREFTLNHGDYEKESAEEAAIADATNDNAFNTDDDIDDDDDLLDLEPDEEELLNIELELMESEKVPVETNKKKTEKHVKNKTKASEKVPKTAKKTAKEQVQTVSPKTAVKISRSTTKNTKKVAKEK